MICLLGEIIDTILYNIVVLYLSIFLVYDTKLYGFLILYYLMLCYSVLYCICFIFCSIIPKETSFTSPLPQVPCGPRATLGGVRVRVGKVAAIIDLPTLPPKDYAHTAARRAVGL